MTPGGRDITFPIAWSEATRSRVLRALWSVWSDAVYEDANADYCAPLLEALRSAPPGTEFFVYRDESSRRTWDDEGATPFNDDTMIHILGSSRSLTMVVGTIGGVTAQLADFVRHCLTIGGAIVGEATGTGATNLHAAGGIRAAA